jgi:hypothetical protein
MMRVGICKYKLVRFEPVKIFCHTIRSCILATEVMSLAYLAKKELLGY